MKKIIFPLLLMLAISFNIKAQDTSTKELRADKYLFNYSYDKAVKTLSQADELTIDGQRSLAVSYHKLNKNLQSDSVYALFINSAAGVIPEDYFNYAMVLKSNGNIEKSVLMMDKFSAAKPLDLRAIDYQNHKYDYLNWLTDNGKFKIEQLTVNTKAQEFGPTYYMDKIVFTSNRATSKIFEREDNWHNEPYLDIYVSEVDNTQLKSPKYFDKELNGKFHDGPASFTKDGNFMAFTRNNLHDKSKDRVVELQIYFSSKKDGKWTTPEAFNHNNPAYSVGHPCLSADGNTMYFTCDMKGGFGGADIYKVWKSPNGIWGTPVNLGDKINTEGDEQFPFYEENSKMLFFTSDGRYGVGGLDVFIADLSGFTVGSVTNAGFPINSQFDDFSAIINDKFSKGYFASNRSGSDDLYSLSIFKTDSSRKLQGYALEKSTKVIPGAHISLLNEDFSLKDSLTTSADGAYSFDVVANKNYKLVGSKLAYQDGNNTANTFGPDLIVHADVILSKVPNIVPKADLAVELELNPIYFDLDKSNIRDDAKVELDKIIKVMNENPNLVVELSSHTDCRASAKYNQNLSDRRAKSSVKYIRAKITKPSRLTGKGHGEATDSKACPCEGDAITTCTDADYQIERNTEFIVVKDEMVKK